MVNRSQEKSDHSLQMEEYMNRCKTKKAIAKIIWQGNNEETQELFNIIFEVMQEVFTEENVPGLTSFMLENTERSMEEYKRRMR